MSGHLGDLAAALVDGQLAPAVRDRALRHVAQCDRCRDEVAAQERLKAQLSHLFPPPPPTDLSSRLLQLPSSPVLAGGVSVDGLSGRSRGALVAPFRPAGRADRVTRPRSHPAHRRMRRVMFASASVLVLGAGGAFAAGGPAASGGPQVTPPTTAYLTQHVSTTNVTPFSDPAAAVVAFRPQR